jgi:hypothetical protein
MRMDLPITRAIVRELPDALRPDWAARTWGGAFGTLGLRADVTKVDTVVTLSELGVVGTSKVGGRVIGQPTGLLDRIRTLGGRRELHSGSFGHTVTLDGSGRLAVHHHSLTLARDSRGTGFGNGFVDHARARYGGAGIDDVTMFAGLSVGGYAWARQGLELATTATDDTAKLLDRGRQIAEMVDSSRGLIDVSGRIPRLRRLTAEQHATIAPRLVRDATLPPDAITSMEQLAAVPDIGRRVLLGRMWKGSVEIDRTAVWWHRNGTGAAGEAAALPSYRTDPARVLEESRAAARRIASELPAAVDPFRANETFMRHLAGVGVTAVDDAAEGARAVLRTSMRSPAPSVETKIPLLTATGRKLELTVAWDGAKLVATERIPIRDWRNADLRRAIDAAWRELGVEQVRSAHTALRRSIPAP